MLRKYGIRRLKTADSIWLSPYTCSLAEAAPPQPQENNAWNEPYYLLEYEQMLLEPKYRTGVHCWTGQNTTH